MIIVTFLMKINSISVPARGSQNSVTADLVSHYLGKDQGEVRKGVRSQWEGPGSLQQSRRWPQSVKVKTRMFNFILKWNISELMWRSTGWTRTLRDNRWTTARTSTQTSFRKLMSFRLVKIEICDWLSSKSSQNKARKLSGVTEARSGSPHTLEMVFRVTTDSGGLTST